MLPSSGWPSLEVSRYFLSQMSREASWNGTESKSRTTSFITEFIALAAPLSPRNREKIIPTQHKILLCERRRVNKPNGHRQDYEIWKIEILLELIQHLMKIFAAQARSKRFSILLALANRLPLHLVYGLFTGCPRPAHTAPTAYPQPQGASKGT